MGSTLLHAAEGKVQVPRAGIASPLQTTDVAGISAQQRPDPGNILLVLLKLTLECVLERPRPGHRNSRGAEGRLQTLPLCSISAMSWGCLWRHTSAETSYF